MNIKLPFETIAAICAIVVSVIALYVAWDQSQVMRAQQHASVWPIVNSEISLDRNEEENFISFAVKNVGVGPAIIQQASLSVNGQSIKKYDELSDAIFDEVLSNKAGVVAANYLGVLGAGESRTALKLSWPRDEEHDAAFVGLLRKFLGEGKYNFNVELCYCSVFERCWINSENTLNRPQNVEKCEVQHKDLVQDLLSSR